MAKKYIEVYYDLTEEEMQALINAAKDKDSKAILELLKIFSNFLTKYVTLLYYGKFSLNDYDIRRFVALFVKDRTINFYLVRNKLDARGVKHVQEAMRGIQYMVNRYGTEEDVRQTVQMAFLHCLDRYERKNSIPFSGYLYSYYFYVLKKSVDALLVDQLGRKTFPLIDDGDIEGDENDERHPGFTAPPSPAAEDLLFAEEIDEFWVAGDTCSFPFSCLTPQERQLLKWRYVDTTIDPNGTLRPMRSSDIAYRITEHPNTAREHYNKIRIKLREAIQADLGEFSDP